MIDSHTHLDMCARPDADLVADAERAGVHRMLTVGTDAGSCRAALAASDELEHVRAAVGRHPNAAAGFGGSDVADLLALSAHERCAAVGETGLDYHRDRAPRADQERAFRSHIELARETGKPLVVHTRAAADDTLRILRDHAAGVRVILHCFSMVERLEECLEHEWLISFAGNVTYPSAGDLRDAAARVPADRLLVETDAPFLAPQPVRGRENEPAHVVHTARVVATARGTRYEDLEAQVQRNAAEAFGW
jgi:TatD DNase family protein